MSVAGLGCGGHSRLGLSTGHDEDHAVRVIRAAIDLGINYIDTAEGYANEHVVGRALAEAGPAAQRVIVSSKTSARRRDESAAETGPPRLATADDILTSLEASLKKLRRERIDVYHVHGLSAEAYAHAAAEIVPALHKARDAGKIAHLAVSERFETEPAHDMLKLAVEDDLFDVWMVGFNLLNFSARPLLERAAAKGVGVELMFAVRQALSRPARLGEVLRELQARGQITPDAAGDDLAFLTAPGVAGTLQEAAYRFCRHEPNTHVTLFGTGSLEHLKANVAAILAGPLPQETVQEIERRFGRVDSVSGS